MKNQQDIEKKKELLKYYYGEKHYSQAKCVKLLGPGISRNTIKKWLKELNLPIRTFNEAIQYANSHKKNKQEDYFSVESENMAWILGFLASDGTIGLKNNRIKIGLSAIDKEILEKIKQEISIENKITEYITNKGYEVVELSWTCAQHKKDLAKYGIIPQKTYYLTPPYKLNEKYFLDFLRGYFDGDGSISHKSSGGITFSIGSCAKEILEWFVENLEKQYNIPKVKILEDHRNKNTYYYFCYSTNSSKQLYKLLYKNPDSLKLLRKYNKYTNMCM